MTRRLEAIGFERPFLKESCGTVEDCVATTDPMRKAMRYEGQSVRMGLEGNPDTFGHIISANAGEILMMPYVSVLPIPGQAPNVALVTEGKPLSINPKIVERVEPVPAEYLEAYVKGLKLEYNQGEGENGRD